MTKEYTNTINKNEDVNVDGITFIKREDGNYALPGGGHFTNRGYAEKAAKRLARNHPQCKTEISKLVDKTVKRLSGASRETSVMSA